MIHHVSVGTNDLQRSKRFYDALLPVVGLQFMAKAEDGVGYGSGQFHFSMQVPLDGQPATVGNGSHVAFAVEQRAVVDRFHQVALAHGGTSEGAPGLRTQYDPHYYGAFVRDPDGNKLEAVTYAAN